MPKRKIYLVSPREPSGATWLINCLLELGIKTYRERGSIPESMWLLDGKRHTLSPHEEMLRKWLPALADHDSFAFRNDLEVEWIHDWISAIHADAEILYFVRDPRDALFSRYKREAPDLTYREFVAFPDVRTLLDKVVNWRLFNKTWLTHRRLSVFRFEDYKTDAEGTLASVLRALNLHYGHADISRAAQASTFERAAAAEKAYRETHPEDTQLINRSGRPREWRAGEIDHQVVSRIEGSCADMLAHFGYPSPTSQPWSVSIESHVSRLNFLGSMNLDRTALNWNAASDIQEDAFASVVKFISSLDSDLLTRAQLPEYEMHQLRSSLREYLGNLNSQIDDCFAQLIGPTGQSRPSFLSLTRITRGLSRQLRRIYSGSI